MRFLKTPFLRTLAALALGIVALPQASGARPFLSLDVNTGTVLTSHEADRSWHPASVTKLMTATIALEAVRAGKLSMSSPITFSRTAASVQPSKLGLRPGSSIPLDLALRIMLTRSMNDVAVAIAEAISGNEASFARLMNLKAASIGMRGTRFANASGLHDSRQVSTAADLAILARHLVTDFPESERFFGIPSISYGDRTFRNTNGLTGIYPGIQGMKTGYVCASGYNLVALAERDGRKVVTVVLGAPSAGQRERESARLLDMAFEGQASGTPLVSGATRPEAAIDLRKHACGKKLGEDFPRGEMIAAASSVPVPETKPEREWNIAGSMEDYAR